METKSTSEPLLSTTWSDRDLFRTEDFQQVLRQEMDTTASRPLNSLNFVTSMTEFDTDSYTPALDDEESNFQRRKSELHSKSGITYPDSFLLGMPEMHPRCDSAPDVLLAKVFGDNPRHKPPPRQPSTSSSLTNFIIRTEDDSEEEECYNSSLPQSPRAQASEILHQLIMQFKDSRSGQAAGRSQAAPQDSFATNRNGPIDPHAFPEKSPTALDSYIDSFSPSANFQDPPFRSTPMRTPPAESLGPSRPLSDSLFQNPFFGKQFNQPCQAPSNVDWRDTSQMFENQLKLLRSQFNLRNEEVREVSSGSPVPPGRVAAPAPPVPVPVRPCPVDPPRPHQTHPRGLNEKQQRLVNVIKEFLRDKETNTFGGPVPSERVQNCIRASHKELYDSVVGSKYGNLWHRFLLHPKVAEQVVLCQAERNRWYIRLPEDHYWENSLHERAEEKHLKENWMRVELTTYLKRCPSGQCTPDEFLTYFRNRVEGDPGIASALGPSLEKSFPRRGQFVRFVKKNDPYFQYDNDEFLISLRP